MPRHGTICLVKIGRRRDAGSSDALGRQKEIGTLELGKRADLAIWNVGPPAELVYRLGHEPLHSRIRKG